MAKTLTNDEIAIEILNFFFHKKPISEHQLNDDLRDFSAFIYAEGLEASSTMDLVPRPSFGKPNFKWLSKQAVKAVWRSQKEEGIYISIRNSISWKNRSTYEMAKEGI